MRITNVSSLRIYGLWSLLFLSSLHAACGVPVTSETFGKLYHDELCRQVEKCCQGKAISSEGKAFFGENLQACQASYDKDRSIGGGTLNFKKVIDEVLKNPNVSFNATNAAACLAAVQGISCGASAFSAPPTSCRLTFEGKINDGGSCTGSECAPGLVCTFTDGARVCKKTVALGAACSASEPCDSDVAYCDFLGSKTCTAFKGVGEACEAGACKAGMNCTNGKCEEIGFTSFCK